MSRDVRGWCLGRDSAGVPTLSECAVVRGAEGRYFTQLVDSQNNAITVRTYQRGETFFTSHGQALEVLVGRLEALKTRYFAELAYLDDRIREALEAEKEAGDAGR